MKAAARHLDVDCEILTMNLFNDKKASMLIPILLVFYFFSNNASAETCIDTSGRLNFQTARDQMIPCVSEYVALTSLDFYPSFTPGVEYMSITELTAYIFLWCVVLVAFSRF